MLAVIRMSSTNKLMRVSTPELLWHGGGNEHGKPDPIYSLDYHPTESVLLTTGIDASTPPKGSVRVSMIFIIMIIQRTTYLLLFHV